MKPTFYIRWQEQSTDAQLEGACASNARFYPENGNTYFVLQQWFEGEADEDGEWKDISVDYSFNNKLRTNML